MEKQIGILYSPLLLTDSEVEQIKSELQSIELVFQKRKLGIQNAIWDEIIAELYLKFDLSIILVDDVTWEGFKLLLLKLLISGKDKVMQMITSENGHPMLTDMPKHFIRIPIQIDKHYHQHFLISNKLRKEVV